MNKIRKVFITLGLIINVTILMSQTIIQYDFRVEGACGMCEVRIEEAALNISGVISADYHLESKMLSVNIDEDKVLISSVKLAIAQAGYDNGNFMAPQESYDNLPGCCQYRFALDNSTHANEGLPVDSDSLFNKDALQEYSFNVKGSCGMCEDRIEETALNTKGVHNADYNLESQMLDVIIDESQISITELKEAIALAGHDNGSFLTPQKVYNDLPACCNYREENLKSPENPSSGHDEVDGKNVDQHAEGIHVQTIEGRIFGKDKNGKRFSLIGANVLLGDSKKGTTTNFDGYFTLDNSKIRAKSIDVSYIGYEPQTITINHEGLLDITLNDGFKMDIVEVIYKKRTTEVSFIKTINSETITREELCKAACCNLSESFETNPSVDVSFPDAITGTRQIQMLGLAGPYVQITRELMPDVRVLSSIYGLSMTPGPWIESIQLIKGAGSVVNGFESLTGQINVELKKPERGEQLFFNGFLNNGGRMELNANYRHDVTENIASGLLFHAKQIEIAHDKNGDGFTDMPLEKDFTLANRWKFARVKNIEGQLGIKYSSMNHRGGSHDHFSGVNDEHNTHWRMNLDADRYEAWAKIGFINDSNPENSVGLQLNAERHDQNSQFGNGVYNSQQTSLFANLIFQRIPNNNHIFRTGITYHLDDITEHVGKAGIFDRYESIPGAYFEYTYKDDKKWSVVPGIRLDHHSNYGFFVTPRLHAKYNFSEKSIVRISAGRGLKTASIFSENLGLFSSSREFNILQTNNVNPYGLDPEIAWNYGVNFTKAFDISTKELILSFDAYRTSFENQIVVDLETPGRVSFYNLEGSSYSNSIQLKLEYSLFENFDIRMAYRMFDVKTTYGENTLEKPLVSKHRSFINLVYKTESDWHFDATLNWNGQRRLPYTQSNPVEYRRPERSPNYFLLNAQIMKRWGTKWDLYLGAENLLNFKQNDAIIAGEDPFGQYFDASIVWAPLFGANIYIGFRYNLVAE